MALGTRTKRRMTKHRMTKRQMTKRRQWQYVESDKTSKIKKWKICEIYITYTTKSTSSCISFNATKCPVSLLTVPSTNTLVKMSGEHNHSNMNIERMVKDVINEAISSAAILPTVAPRTVLGSIAVNLEKNLPGTSGFIPSRNTVTQAINRARRKIQGHPPVPKTFEDLQEIPEQFTR